MAAAPAAAPPKRAQHDEYKMVGNYKVKAALGEGVNGAVRLGVDVRNGEKVALKFMLRTAMKQRQMDRLDREIRLLTLLYHPNIVELKEVIEMPEEGYVVFAMERCQRGELLKYITDHNFIPEAKFRPMFRSILSAVDYCHRNSVVHRDLKPENILLDDHKNVKIIDFGLSNLYDNEKLLETFCGSPKYAAPEIITGVKYLGPSVDIWSIGVILFASLCGKLPFNGSTIEKTYARVLQGVINYPPHLSPEAKDLIGKILQVDLTKRITMEEIMQHEWVRRDFAAPIDSYLPARPATVETPDAGAVEQLVKFGYSEADIAKALHTPGAEPIKNTYFLIMERRLRLESKAGMSSSTSTDFGNRAAASVFNFLRSTLHPKRNAFEKDGFVLDLQYVHERVIVMAFPADQSLNPLAVNPIGEVARFLETAGPTNRRHKDHYLVFNLCPGPTGGYNPDRLGGHVKRFQMPLLGPDVKPRRALHRLCRSQVAVDCARAMAQWLDGSPANVVAIHAKDDIARCAVTTCLWMIMANVAKTPEQALQLYSEKVLVDGKSKQLPPSVDRYVRYVYQVYQNNFTLPPDRLLSLSHVILSSPPEFDVSGGCEPVVKVNLNKLRVLKTASGRLYSARKGDGAVVLPCETVPLSDDVLVRVTDRDGIASELMFSFRLNLRFLDSLHHPETVSARARAWSRGASDGPNGAGAGGGNAPAMLGPTLSAGVGSPTAAPTSSTLDTLRQPARRAIRAIMLPFRRTGTGKGPGQAGTPGPAEASEWIEVAPAPIERKMPLSPTSSTATTDAPDEDDDVPLDGGAAPDEEEEDDVDSDMDEEMDRPRDHGDDMLTSIQADDGPADSTGSPAGLGAGTATATANPVAALPTVSVATTTMSETVAGAASATAASLDQLAVRTGAASASLDPYIAKRIRVTLTKAELDMDRPDRFPDDFSVTLYFREPRLRRFTREDILATAVRELQDAELGSRTVGGGDDNNNRTLTNIPLGPRDSARGGVSSSGDTLTNLPLANAEAK